MSTDSKAEYGDSSGPAASLQLDAGLRLLAPLAVHATLLYDYSNWLELPQSIGRHGGSMLGLGLGATVSVSGISLGVAAGGQFTFFPSNDDPGSGPVGASLGPFVSGIAGYVWRLVDDTSIGVHGFARYRRSKDETNSFVYDPHGYQVGLMLSFGIDGEPLLDR